MTKSRFGAILVISALSILSTGSTFAARAYATEIGYFDEYGNMNGSITYPCEGGKWIEGELVGTPVLIDSWACLCTNGECYGP